MKVSRTVAYALQAAMQLAESDNKSPTPCSKLAAEGGMPERFLLQILRSLVTHGILQSTRGVEGGYALTRGPEEISVLQIMEAIEGPMSSSFPTTEQFDEGSRDRLSEALKEVASTARQQLDAIKLSQLVPPKASDGDRIASIEASPNASSPDDGSGSSPDDGSGGNGNPNVRAATIAR